ncbi:hypothetical protein BN14_12348 [Rhizoctonia solani AG-1 IB]|uniref:Uncharacterized protein n=1 Tax=Thanatephorus cucumeris (strain AG1-IB / isolate 7/3/14) TaxID=1108050 RepID=M5CDY3_THACB|nr:hypothetical protein BN14_12348 [Rhizoctonia solani AG-1 IB]
MPKAGPVPFPLSKSATAKAALGSKPNPSASASPAKKCYEPAPVVEPGKSSGPGTVLSTNEKNKSVKCKTINNEREDNKELIGKWEVKESSKKPWTSMPRDVAKDNIIDISSNRSPLFLNKFTRKQLTGS